MKHLLSRVWRVSLAILIGLFPVLHVLILLLVGFIAPLTVYFSLPPQRVQAVTRELEWVGGTDTWNAVAGNKWAIEGTGVPGEAIPDTDDNVHFNAGSGAVTVTLSNGIVCQDFDSTGFSGAFSGANSLDTYGSVTLGGDFTGSLHFNAAAGSHTLTTNGNSFHYFVIEGAGTLSMADDVLLDDTVNFSLSNGTLNTNNHNIGSTGNFSSFTINSGTANLGTSTITMAATSPGFTILGGTVDIDGATIDITSTTINGITFAGGGRTFGTVHLHDVRDGTTITGANTFATLLIDGDSTAGDYLTFAADQVITGTLTISGYNATTRRLGVYSSVLGTSRQLTAAVVAITNCNLRDIAGVGAASWDISAGLNADFGGNYNIIFTTPINCYWVGNSGSWSDVTHWSIASDGTGGGTGRVPIPAIDVAIFNSYSVTYGPGVVTVTMDIPDVSSIDASAVLWSPIFSGTPVNIYGSLDLGTVTWSVTDTYMTSAYPSVLRSTSSLINLYIATTHMAVCYLGGDIVSTGAVTLSSGVFDLNSYYLTATTFNSSTTTYTRQLMLGEGVFTLNSAAAGTKWNVAAANFTLSRESGTIVLTNSGANAQTFAGAGLTYGNVYITGAGNYTLSITGANTFRDLTIDRSMSVAKTVKFPTSATTLVSNFYIPVDAAHTVVTLVGTTAPPTALVWTISKASGVVITDYVSIEDSTAAGGAIFYGGSHSTFVSHVTGWLLSDPTAPFVETSAVTNLTYNSVTLNGQLLSIYPVSLGYASFEWGLTSSYGAVTSEYLLAGLGTYSHSLTGLDYATTYHYRAVFRYSGVVYTYGSDVEFTTQAAPPGIPTVVTGTATNVLATSATLQGSLTDLGLYTPIYVYFEYGPTTAYGTSTTEITETIVTSYNTNITGLTEGTTYYFRAVARFDVSSHVYGSGATFTYSAPGSGGFASRRQVEAPPTVLPAPQGLNLFENPPASMNGWPGHPAMSKAAASMGWDEPILYSVFFIMIALIVGLAATVAVNTIWGFIIGFGVTNGAFASTGIGATWLNLICVGVAIMLGFLWRNN